MNNKEHKVKGCSLIALFLLPLLLCRPGFTATYYVDATNGNDGNNGVSTATAWKSISRVNDSYFNPGDAVLFKKGEVWQQKLTVPSSGAPGNPVTFGAYGSGDNPLISGPGINHCIDIVNKPYISIDSIDCRYAEDEGINVESSNYFTIKNLTVSYCYSDGINIHSGSITGGLVDNCVTHHNGHTIPGNAQGAGIILYNGATGNVVQNCRSYGNKEDGIGLAGPQGQFCGTGNIVQFNECYDNGESGIDVKKGPNIVRNNILRNNLGANDNEGQGIAVGWDAEQVEMTYNEIHSNTFRGISIWGVGGRHRIAYNRIYNNALEGIYSDGGSSSNIFYNQIYNNGQYGIFLASNGAKSYRIYNNTIWNNIDYQLISSAQGTDVKNNILGSLRNGDVSIAFAGDGTTETNSNYNALVGVGNHCRWGSSYLSFNEFKSHSSQDANSINQNPVFADEQLRDFSLQPLSPCINSGTDTGLVQDFQKNPVPQGSRVDMGALEYMEPRLFPPKNLQIL
jgi:hypothetical protein